MEELFYKGAKVEFDRADIVARLRDGQQWAEASIVEGLTSYTIDMLKEAANEIERLRSLLADAEIANLHAQRKGELR